jgi:hypothetical protein
MHGSENNVLLGVNSHFLLFVKLEHFNFSQLLFIYFVDCVCKCKSLGLI